MVEINTKKVISALKKNGYVFKRHGSNHDVYAKDGYLDAVIPRSKQLSVGVAKQLLKLANRSL